MNGSQVEGTEKEDEEAETKKMKRMKKKNETRSTGVYSYTEVSLILMSP